MSINFLDGSTNQQQPIPNPDAGQTEQAKVRKKRSIPYKERKEAKRVCVLICDGQVMGVWSTLKRLCEDMKAQNSSFLSYWTLAKRDKNAPITFKAKNGQEYTVCVQKIN